MVIGAGSAKYNIFSEKASAYPATEYDYKIFCWDKNHAPLFDAINIS